MGEKLLMKGNEAIAEAALRAGCRHYFGYPITPQTEIAHYLAKKMPEVGGTFIQAESEVAAINMVYGAASAGARVLTSSSSPGISLETGRTVLSCRCGASGCCCQYRKMWTGSWRNTACTGRLFPGCERWRSRRLQDGCTGTFQRSGTL